MNQLPKLLYIVGAGRSGSTLLGFVLSCLDDSVYVGELDRVWRHGGIPRYDPRDQPETHRVWESVRRDLPFEIRRTDADRRYVEHPSSPLRFSPRARVVREEYLAKHTELLRSIGRVTGADLVIDSSHHPLRRLRMSEYAGGVATVHLVRDPHQVVESFTRGAAPNKSLLMSNLYLLINDWLTKLVKRRAQGALWVELRYEDLVASPEDALRVIAQALNRGWSWPDSIPVGPVFSGNRIAKERSVKVLSQPSRPPSKRLLTVLMQSRTRKRWGYST